MPFSFGDETYGDGKTGKGVQRLPRLYLEYNTGNVNNKEVPYEDILHGEETYESVTYRDVSY